MLPNFSVAISSYDLFRKQFHPWRATWRHDNRVLPNFSVAISLNYFTFIFPENNFIREERLDVTLSGCCQISSFPFLAIILLLPFPKTISSMKSNLTSRQLGAAKFFRCHFWQLLYFYLFRKQFHSWRATLRHDNWVLPSFSVAISGNYFTFIFSENNFVGEERLDVTTTGCCQTSTLPFLAITLLLSFPKTSSSVKSDLTSDNWELPNFYVAISGYDLSRKQFHPWRATWRHAKWVLPNFFVSIPCNYFTFTFSENNFIHEEQLDVTTTGCCQIPPLPFLAITLLLYFPKTSSSVKSDLTSRQLGAAKLLRCHCWLWSFPKTISSLKSDLPSRQLGGAKLLRCHFCQLLYFHLFRKHLHPWRATWRHDNWVLPNFYVAIAGYDLFRKLLHPWRATWRPDNWELPNFYVAISGYDLSRKQFHPWRATWRHAKWVLPNFFVSIPCNYFTFTFSENNFIHEEQLDVTTTGCCQIPPLPFLAITLLLYFPKTSSSVKSDLTSRQLGAAKLLRCHCWLWSFPKTISSLKSDLPSRQLGGAKLLRCHFCQLLYFHLFRKHLHPWRATWRHDNWVLPNFYVAIAGYDLFRKQFHPWRATCRHDNWVLPNSSVAISGNYFTFIFSENIFIREERLDVTTTGCCQTSTLPLLAMIFSENNFVAEERLAVTTTGWCQASTLPFLSITLLSSFPETSSSVKSDLTSRQLGAAKLLRCHCWLWSFPKTIPSVKSDLPSRQLGAAKLLRCHCWLWSFPKTIPSVKSDLPSRQLGAAKLLRCHCWLWSFPKTSSSVKSDLTSRQLGAAKLLRCHFWLWSFPKTISSVKSDLTSR